MVNPTIQYSQHCGLILLCISVVFSDDVQASEAPEKLLFVFGDSLFDAGNNQYYTPTIYIPANHHPYGMSSFDATGRHSDGFLVPDFIAEYANMPLIPPALDPSADGSFGFNFASAGSGVLYHADAMNLKEQLALFINLTAKVNEDGEDEEYENVLGNSVYMFSAGGNDYAAFSIDVLNATRRDMQDFVDLVIRGTQSAIKAIYERGGRKFAFQDVGPIGCIPLIKYAMGLTEGCYEEANTIAKLHNKALRKALQNLTQSQEYKDIKYGVFDYYNHLTYRFQNATDYGFKDGEIACCGYGGKLNAENCGTSPYFLCSNPRDFVLFDGRHTTETANSQLAKLMWSGHTSFMAPYNMKQLFQGDGDDVVLRELKNIS